MKIAIVFEIDKNPHFCKKLSDEDQALNASFDLASETEINLIESAFCSLGHRVERINGPKELLQRASDLSASGTIVFNKSRGLSGLERKITVPVICDHFKIPCIGSSGYVATLARHKYHTNRLLAGLGFRVPFAILVKCGQNVPPNLTCSKVIVKPNHEAGALGIDETSIADNHEALSKAVARIHRQFKQPAIIEEYIKGEEFKIAVIGNASNAKALGCVAVMANGKPLTGSLQTREDVRLNRLEYYTPDDPALINEALSTAVDVHSAFECRDYSRIDFRISDNNSHAVCMEVSTQPDLEDHSSFITAARRTLTNYKDVLKTILNTSLKRYGITK